MADDPRDSIIDPADHVLYDEVVRCLQANAFRAAYVMSWIAAAEGILGKLRTMASLHAALGTFVGDFEAKQRAGTAKDAELIDRAFDVGLIDGPERIQLNAMRDLRNQYGHPTSASPNREMALHALRTTVNAVLAKPALIMHGGATDLARRAATDRHLVPADAAAIDSFVATRAAAIHADARPVFVRELLAGAGSQLGDPNGEMLVDRCIRMTTRALALWAEQLSPPTWNVDQLQLDWPAVAADALCDPEVWPLIEPEDRNRLLSRCLDPAIAASFSRTPGRLLARADTLWASDLLSDAQVDRVRTALGAADPWRLLGADVRYEHVARAIVGRLDNGAFNVAGEGVELIRSTDDALLAALDEGLQFEIGRALAYAANRNTFSAINEIESMLGFLDRWPIALRRGVVVGGLTGMWMPLRHEETSKVALRLALSDEGGDLAQAAIDELTPEKLEGLASPSLVASLRTILGSAPATPAVEKLTEFLDRVEAGVHRTMADLRDFD